MMMRETINEICTALCKKHNFKQESKEYTYRVIFSGFNNKYLADAPLALRLISGGLTVGEGSEKKL
jgi:hypothetical protein